MSEVTFQFVIDGEEWKECHLKRLEYERNLHVLHQMKRHGLKVADGDRILTDDEIDCLTAAKAWEVSINTRANYTGNDILELYKDSLAQSDEMWRALPFSQELPMKASYCYMSADGVTLPEFMEIMRLLQAEPYTLLASHPEHFSAITGMDKLMGLEPFGMFGTPTLCLMNPGVDISELGPQIQADRDPEYPSYIAGRAYLTDGTTEINVPFHQFKSTEHGFEAKLAVYWPEGSPDEVVSGHCLHLAMEFYEGLKIIRDRKAQ